MSKYQALFETLRQQIEDETYPYGSYLPSENELLKLYGASRDTVRKGLALLVKEAYIKKEHGKGSLVIYRAPLASISSPKEERKPKQEQEIHGSFPVKEVESSLIKADAMQAYLLHTKTGALLQKYIRIYYSDQEKIALETQLIFQEEHPLADEKEASALRKEMTCIKVRQKEKEMLDLQEFDMLVCVRTLAYTKEGAIGFYKEVLYRPDKFRFVEYTKQPI
jgi:GntR family trehalose operon transcriptional repressor